MDVLQFHFYFPQKCVMRSSSIESNNTTIYNRPILCNSQEQLGESFFFFLSLFSEMVMPIFRVQPLARWQLSKQRCTLPVWGRKKTKMLTNKQDDMVHKFESRGATNLSGITADRNQLANTV